MVDALASLGKHFVCHMIKMCTLVQNRLGRVLCNTIGKHTLQSTLPSLFCTSMVEYSAKSIQSPHYLMEYTAYF